jgi:hypothetical protein
MSRNKKPSASWKSDELARIESLANEQLLDRALDSGCGDDWDGCFTNEGAFTYAALKFELRKRLAAWLTAKS